MKRRPVLVASAFIAAMLVGGCASSQIGRFTSQASLYTDEKDMMTELSSQMLRAGMRLSNDPEAWAAVREVLDRLTKDRPRRTEFAVLENPVPNAVTLPNGKIYVTTGLLAVADTEHALAGVLGHELSHYDLKHYESRVKRADFMLGAFYVVTHVFDQKEELAADREGVRLVKKAGYAPGGLIDFFRGMQRLERRWETQFGGFGSSHPDIEARIGSLRDILAQEGGPGESVAKSEAFAAYKRMAAERARQYRPRPRLETEPPRFASGSREFDAKLDRALAHLDTHHDLATASKLLDELMKAAEGTESGGDAKKRAAVEVALARLELERAAPHVADAHLAAAEKAWPGLQAARWLRVQALVEMGHRGEARDLWHRQYGDPSCARELECLRLAAETVDEALDDDVEAQAAAAAAYRKAVLAAGGAADATASATLSQTSPSEIRAPIEDGETGTPAPEMPNGFVPSREYSDWLALRSAHAKGDLELGYSEHGSSIGVTGGFGSTTGALSRFVSSGANLGFTVGWRFWPWDFGLDLVNPLGRDHSFTQIGAYLTHFWSKERFRPLTKLTLFSASVRDPDADLKFGGGGGVGLDAGFSWRLGRRRSMVDTNVVFGLGARHLWLRLPDDPTGRSLAFQAMAGIEFVMNPQIEADLEKSDARRAIVREPMPFW